VTNRRYDLASYRRAIAGLCSDSATGKAWAVVEDRDNGSFDGVISNGALKPGARQGSGLRRGGGRDAPRGGGWRSRPSLRSASSRSAIGHKAKLREPSSADQQTTPEIPLAGLLPADGKSGYSVCGLVAGEFTELVSLRRRRARGR
jgi:hypothetical protein